MDAEFPPLLLSHILFFAVVIGATSHARSETSWRVVRGADLFALLAGHELADGVHYAYRFSAAGIFTGLNMGKEIHGTWRLAGDDFCWTSAKREAEEECLAVERRGTSLRFMRDGYEAFAATVTPIKPQPNDEAPR